MLKFILIAIGTSIFIALALTGVVYALATSLDSSDFFSEDIDA